MQVVKNTLIGIIVFWFAILLFMPKTALYYTLENSLAKQNIEINEKTIEEGIFSLRIMDIDVYVKGIKVATVKEINIFTLLFHTSVSVNEILFDDSLKSFIPQKIEKSVLFHSILSPLQVFMTTMGSFGLAEGTLDLNTQTVRIDIIDAKEIETIQSQLRKDEKGWYYETSF